MVGWWCASKSTITNFAVTPLRPTLFHIPAFISTIQYSFFILRYQICNDYSMWRFPCIHSSSTSTVKRLGIQNVNASDMDHTTPYTNSNRFGKHLYSNSLMLFAKHHLRPRRRFIFHRLDNLSKITRPTSTSIWFKQGAMVRYSTLWLF